MRPGYHHGNSIRKSTKFLGVRRVQSSSSWITTRLLGEPVRALMPDGGLSPCVIKVVGVGGGGSNAIDRMMETSVEGVEFWAVNTDAQALGRSKAKGTDSDDITL
jgi:hypothetical protein